MNRTKTRPPRHAILVVDDEPDMRALLSRELAGTYTVIPAPGTSARPAARDFVQKEAAGKDAGGELRASPVQIKPVNPLVEKLLK